MREKINSMLVTVQCVPASPENSLFCGPGFGTLFCSNIVPASCYFMVSLVSSIVKVHVVFLAGLRASARMTACCACLGVGFIAIPSFLFVFARASFRQDKQKSHLFFGRSTGQTRTAFFSCHQ